MNLLIGAGEAVLAGLLIGLTALVAAGIIANRRKARQRSPPRRGAIQVLPPMPSRPLNGNHGEDERREAMAVHMLSTAHRRDQDD